MATCKAPTASRSAVSRAESQCQVGQGEKRIIIVIGGPGCGKGTQCNLLAQKYGFTHLSTGDLMRNEIVSDTPRGNILKEALDKGELAPLEIVLELLREAIHNSDSESSGFVIDGFPRELDQAKLFECEVGPVEKVIYLKVSDATMKKRILDRGKNDGQCENMTGTIAPSNDNEETAKKRIAAFKKTSPPIIKHYTKEKKLNEISAEACAGEVFVAVVRAMEKRGNCH